MYPSFFRLPSICLPDYLTVYVFIYPSVCLSACLSVCLKREVEGDRSTSKTKKFCETSSMFDIDNVKNEAILRDFLQKWKVTLSAEPTASYHCVLRFFHCICLKYCACHEKVKPGHTKCCTCHTK